VVWRLTFLAFFCGAFVSPVAQAQNGKADPDAAAPLYRRHCQSCHGAEGHNGKHKNGLEAAPDFTSAAWHERRTDVELITSILEGKGTIMPSFRDRLSRAEVKMIVGKIRAFAPAKKEQQKTERRAADSSPTQFEIEFKRLQKEFDELRRQLEELRIKEERPAEESMPPG
jgi:mono/diheme cytochrome c family protein